MHLESFEEDMLSWAKELAEVQVEMCLDMDTMHRGLDLYRLMYPCRMSINANPNPDAADAIARIQAVPQLKQRAPEWYAFRHTLITASSIHKAHGSNAKRNELIVEKCDPTLTVQSLSMEGSRHWGVKYEPVSIAYYESKYGTHIAEFGCLRHPTIPFIGASPDGINDDPTSPLFGRMLEIKNPVSREINGTTKAEYWIQVQNQMAVCGLKSCDFLETHFVEYDSRAAFEADGSFSKSADDKLKGIMLCVIQNEITVYKHPSLEITAEKYETWESEILLSYEWVATLYWKLDDVLCTLIQYNDAWFQSVLPLYQDVWATIEIERETGAWRDRLPKKRVVRV